MKIPGFVDLQVNGYGGVDFSSASLSAEGIAEVRRRLFSRGVVAFCPTVVTCAHDVYAHVLPLLAVACETPQFDGACMPGIHLEGPFINPANGPRGIHPAEFVSSPAIDAFERLREMAQDRVALLTMAPEVNGATALIEHVVNRTKTVVGLGHHMASGEAIHAAASAGARLCVHIGNGMAERIHRHLNPLWPMLADDRLAGGFITDGYHLPPDLIRVAARAKGPARFIVTSDVTHFAGLTPGEYQWAGADIVLEPNGHLHRKGAYQLAGSARDMQQCMNVLAALDEFDSEGLVRVGFANALDLLDVQIPQAVLDEAPLTRLTGRTFKVCSCES